MMEYMVMIRNPWAAKVAALSITSSISTRSVASTHYNLASSIKPIKHLYIQHNDQVVRWAEAEHAQHAHHDKMKQINFDLNSAQFGR